MKDSQTRRGTLRLVLSVTALLTGVDVVLHGAPILTPFPDLVAPEGAIYAGFLVLDEWVADSGASDNDLVWAVSGGGGLDLRLTPERHLVVQPPNADWFGKAELYLTVCNSTGDCAAQTLSLRIENVPDDPVIERIPPQVVDIAEPFAPLDLALFGWDPDGNVDLAWSVESEAPLAGEVVDTVLTVTQPADGTWLGTADVVVTLRDSTGRSATREVAYTASEHPVTLTFVGNEGFLIACGDTKILVDGLVDEGVFLTPNERARLRGAVTPFDGIDLALATHAHYDHFDVPTAAEFLTSSPETVLISLDESIDRLRPRPEFDALSARGIGIPFQAGSRSEFDVAGLRVTAFGITHGFGRSNLAFLIEIGGMRILHLGDAAADLTAEELVAQFAWPSLDIDVALVPYWWLFDTALVDRVAVGIAPRYAIPMHFQRSCPSLLGIETGDVVPIALCREFETWIVPPRADGPAAP